MTFSMQCASLKVLSEAMAEANETKILAAVLPVFSLKSLKDDSFFKFLSLNSKPEGFLSPLSHKLASFVHQVLRLMTSKTINLKEGRNLLAVYAQSLSVMIEESFGHEQHANDCGMTTLDEDDVIVLGESEVLEAQLKTKNAEILELRTEIDELFRHYTEESVEREKTELELQCAQEKPPGEIRRLQTGIFDDLHDQIRSLQIQLAEKDDEIARLRKENSSLGPAAATTESDQKEASTGGRKRTLPPIRPVPVKKLRIDATEAPASEAKFTLANAVRQMYMKAYEVK